jgi:hypothetical protein
VEDSAKKGRVFLCGFMTGDEKTSGCREAADHEVLRASS